MTVIRLVRCSGGAAMIEFALVAPMFIAMLVGLIEFSRAYWIQQTLQEVSYQTARCMAMDERCATQSQRLTFAVDRARDYSVNISEDAVTVESGLSCRGQSNSHEVAIATPFSSPLTGFGFMPEKLHAQACFPVFSGVSEPVT